MCNACKQADTGQPGTSGEDYTQLCLATTLSADSTLPVLQPNNISLLAVACERSGDVFCQAKHSVREASSCVEFGRPRSDAVLLTKLA